MEETKAPGTGADGADKTRDTKKAELFRNQKHTLDLFLERGAISKAQYDKSLGDLIRKMGIRQEDA